MILHGIPMTDGTPWKHLLRFAFPVLLGSLLQQLYNTADTVIVGNFSGEGALAAVGTTGTFAFLFMAMAIGFSAGNGVVVARYFGAGSSDLVRKNAAAGIVFLSVLGVISSVLGIVIALPVFRHFVAVPEMILDMAILYFRVYCLGLFFQFGYNILAGILRAVGDSASTLYFLIVSSVLNVLLDLLFVAGFHWGVVGAALATDIAQAVSFAAALWYMYRKYPLFRFKKADFSSVRLADINETVRIGFPITLQLMIVSCGLTLIQRAVNGFGQAMTASFTVGQRMEMYIHMPAHAMHTTLATFTGQNLGAGKIDRVKCGAMQTILISIVLTMLLALSVWLFHNEIIAFFGIGEAAAVYCRPHLRSLIVTSFILTSYLPLFGLYQGAGHSGVPTMVAIVALSFRVCSTYLLRYSPFLGYSVIWWNGLFGFGAGFTVTWLYYFSNRWQKNAVMTVV